jgi:chromosome segregation ATPase
MRLDNIIEEGDFDDSQKAMDFAAFLLRYNRDIDYSFFSENP